MRKSLKSLMAVFVVCLLSYQLFAAEGVVTYVKGKVEVKKGSSWETVKVGDRISESDMLNTGFQSEAKIKLMDSVLYLGPVTRVTLDTLASSSDKDKVNVYLSTGTVRSKVNHKDNKRVSYTVRTPIAVASVRGTDIIVYPDMAECMEGSMALISNDVFEENAKKEARQKAKQKASKKSDGLKGDKSGTNIETETKIITAGVEDEKVDDDYLKNNKFLDSVEVPTDGYILNANKVARVRSSAFIENPSNVVENGVLDILSKGTSESAKQGVAAKTSAGSTIADAIVGQPAGPETGSVQIVIELNNQNNQE